MKNNISINHSENTVTKTFRSTIACDKEKYLLEMLSGTGLVPQLLQAGNKTITTKHCQGALVADILLADSLQDVCAVIKALAEWMADFGQRFSMAAGSHIVLEDINPRNFIYTGGKITGVDFEAWHIGGSEENLLFLPAMVKNTRFASDYTAAQAYEYAIDIIRRLTGRKVDEIALTAEQFSQKTISRRDLMKIIRKCDCVIIAGGKSSRMGSPKGLLVLDGYTFTDRLIYSAQLFDNLYISANMPEYGCFGCKLIPDIHTDRGPLGALHACLQTTEKDMVFFMPCDSPFITEKTILEFFSKADTAADCSIARCDGRVYPTIGLYRKSALPVIQWHIQQDKLRLISLFEKLDCHYVDINNADELKNINTKEEYAILST